MAWRISRKAQEWVKANQNLHLCGCGCGEFIKVGPEHYYRRGVPKLKRGHHAHPSRPPAERFWKLVEKGESCWLWTGSTHGNGYGRFVLPGYRAVAAHRFSWELHNEPVPEGLHVLHDCPGGDNPACVNPAHLWIGTQLDNVRDMWAKGRANHAHGERVGTAKLTEAKVLEIRRLAAAGERRRVLATMFNMDEMTIGQIVRRDTWDYLCPD